MPTTIAERLRSAGIELLAPARAAAANYVPFRLSGLLLIVSPVADGRG
ncbi:MAG: hypothetical protein U1E17_05890 [Geminicoccaceae bacterium]